MEFELNLKKGLRTVLRWNNYQLQTLGEPSSVPELQVNTPVRSTGQPASLCVLQPGQHSLCDRSQIYTWPRFIRWAMEGGGSTVVKEEDMYGSHQPKSPAPLAPPTKRSGETSLSLGLSRIPVPQPASREARRKRYAFGLAVVS